MLRRRSTSRSVRAALLVALSLAAPTTAPRAAFAQACCAGSGALTPGRLAVGEGALVGTELHASAVLGEYAAGSGRFEGQPAGQSEVDLEEDLFAAVRLLRRGQLALLVPFVETRRQANDAEGFGGGVGDANLSARYDFFYAGQSRVLPGVAALAGVTAPTGRPPTSASAGTLAVGATGTGAWQGDVGVALEQAYGPWLIDASEILAFRAPFSADGVREALAPQWSTLAGVSFVFRSGAALALFGSYALEGDPSIQGVTVAGGSRRATLVGLSGVYPVTSRLRLQASAILNPPLSGLGAGQTAAAGLTLTAIWAWETQALGCALQTR